MAAALSSLKIVEVGEMVSAPYCSKLLADMGAEVVKIERPGAGDRARTRGPYPGDVVHPEKSGLFLYLNTNKRGVTLDITQPEGFAILEKLVADADILIHNVAPPDMDRVGLSYERMRRANPKLIMTSILPFGLTGPYRNYRAEDLTIWCAGGICVLNGAPQFPQLPPLKTAGQQAGYQGGAHGAVATVAAAFAQLRDGAGQHVEVSIQESVAAIPEMTFEYWPYMKMLSTRWGQKPLAPVAPMECKDGYIFLCCIEEHQWRNFVDIMGNPEWAEEEIFKDRLVRAVNWDALKVLLAPWVAQQTVLDLYQKAQARRVPFAPVSTMGDLLSSEHLKARGFFVEIAQPVAGTHLYPGAPLKYARTPWEIRRPAPTLGQHNAEVFGKQLGLSQARLDELKRKGVI
ncbi:MAG: CoA transferase [Candidatus Binatus sp.]|uniref:CaiB/BaiF CoA transferase family protein n=1 Tax=Candidatus Binatus sp. TaxID=2811406 RepID=UPI003C7526A7